MTDDFARDRSCPRCGALNPTASTSCRQCGASALQSEGTRDIAPLASLIRADVPQPGTLSYDSAEDTVMIPPANQMAAAHLLGMDHPEGIIDDRSAHDGSVVPVEAPELAPLAARSPTHAGSPSSLSRNVTSYETPLSGAGRTAITPDRTGTIVSTTPSTESSTAADSSDSILHDADSRSIGMMGVGGGSMAAGSAGLEASGAQSGFPPTVGEQPLAASRSDSDSRQMGTDAAIATEGTPTWPHAQYAGQSKGVRRAALLILSLTLVAAMVLVVLAAHGAFSSHSAATAPTPRPSPGAQATVAPSMPALPGSWQVIAAAASGKPPAAVPSGAYPVARVFGGYLAYDPPPDLAAPAGWPLYRDAAHHISLRYPTGWRTRALANHAGTLFLPQPSSTGNDEPGGPPGVAISWTASATPSGTIAPLPPTGDSASLDLGVVRAGNRSGHLYSVGGANLSALRVVVVVSGGSETLFARADSPALLDQFWRMLASLRSA